MESDTPALSASSKMVWIGRVLSVIPCLLLIFSGAMKLTKSAEVVKGVEHLQLPERLIVPLGILELTCTLIYLIPQTSVLGAILLTGYLGGAILTHLRLGEPVIAQTLFGVVIWLGLFLREPRLRAILPWRS